MTNMACEMDFYGNFNQSNLMECVSNIWRTCCMIFLSFCNRQRLPNRHPGVYPFLQVSNHTQTVWLVKFDVIMGCVDQIGNFVNICWVHDHNWSPMGCHQVKPSRWGWWDVLMTNMTCAMDAYGNFDQSNLMKCVLNICGTRWVTFLSFCNR